MGDFIGQNCGGSTSPLLLFSYLAITGRDSEKCSLAVWTRNGGGEGIGFCEQLIVAPACLSEMSKWPKEPVSNQIHLFIHSTSMYFIPFTD